MFFRVYRTTNSTLLETKSDLKVGNSVTFKKFKNGTRLTYQFNILLFANKLRNKCCFQIYDTTSLLQAQIDNNMY